MISSNRLLLVFCLFFFIFKVFSIYTSKFDLFGDEAQYWLWSLNPDFGYYSKPPLLAWLIAALGFFMGSSFFSLKMISIVFYCITSLVVFNIAKKLYKDSGFGLLAALTFFLTPAVSLSSFLLSTDVLLILFWSLSLMMLLVIKDSPKKINFILMGVFLGLAFMAKYAAIYFFVCLFFLFFEKKIRVIFLKNIISFFYFIFSFLLIVAPNLIWNKTNGWLTFVHTSDNASLDRINFNFFGGVEFLFSQIMMLGPFIFIFFVITLRKGFVLDFNSRFLLIFSVPIFLIIFLESLLVRANANWAAVSLVSFLILFLYSVYSVNKNFTLYNNLFNLFVGLVLFGLIATTSSYEPFKRISGITSFAEDISGDAKKYGNLVVVDRMLYSNLSYIYRNKNIRFYMPYHPNTGISNHFQISDPLKPNFNKNFILLGSENQINYLTNKYEAVLIDEKSVAFQKELIKVYEIIF